MYNLYTNSSIVSLRSRASPSFSFNDHSSYSQSSYDGRCPSFSSSCCCNCNCCCSIPANTVSSCRAVPINPSLPFGFRQSTLIQWPPSRRRVIVSGVDRCGYGALVDDLVRTRNSYGGLCSSRDVGFDRIKVKQIGLWGYRRRVFEERLVFRQIGAANDDAEAIISLLTDEVGEEFLDARERRREKASSFEKGKVRENVVKGKSKLRKVNELENVEVKHRKEGYSTRREREDLVKGEYSRLRKQGSSGSSYYSFSDTGEYESEQEKDELERYKIQGDWYMESGRKDNIEVDTSAKWDRREKYMKQLTEDSVKENAFRKSSVLNESRRPEVHVSGSQKDSRMKKQLRSQYYKNDNHVSQTSDSTYSYEKQTGNSAHFREQSAGSSNKVNDREENAVSSCVFCTSCGQETSGSQTRHNTEQIAKISQTQEDNIKFVLNVETQAESEIKRREERSSLLRKSADELNEQQYQIASGQVNFQNYSEREDATESYEENTNILRRRTKLSEVQNTNTRVVSASKHQSDTRIKRQEETSTLLRTSQEDVNKKIRQENLVAASQTELTKKSQNRSNIVDAGVSGVQTASRIQQQQDARMKNSDYSTISFISSQHVKGEQYRTNTQSGSQNQSVNASQGVSGGSQARIHETVTGISQSTSQRRSHYEQSYMTERVQAAEQRIEMSAQVNERVKQTDLRYELPGSRRESSFHEKETSSPYVTSMSQIRIEEIGDKEVERSISSGPSPRLAPPHQSIERDPVYVDSASRFTRQNSGQSAEGDASIYIYPQATGVSPSGQASGIYEVPSHHVSHVDLLGSAERMDKLSLQIIGEFVEKAQHEASTSVTRIEKKLSGRQLVNEGVADVQVESTQSDRKNHELKKQYSRHSSGSRTTKGPTEEMLSLHEPSQGEASQTAATPVVGRSGRTLWNVLGDIVRFRWGSRAGSQRSPVKSGGQSSSSDSASSEAWFSGHDPDEAQGSDTRRATSNTLLEQSFIDQPVLLRTSTQSPRERLTILNTGEDAGPTLDNAPSSSSGGISGETNLEFIVGEQTSQATTSVDWSQPAAGLLRRSHRRAFATFEGGKEAVGSDRVDQIKHDLDSTLIGVSGSGENVVELEKLLRNKQVMKEKFGSDRVDQIKHDLDSTLTEVSGSGENVVELEGRKLLRNKQVMKERFDEWEEAYRLETEQRKNDEIFMKEALEEAKKAADMWEVPVGAVLVQEGKIIARGYNLVEDLRDSTAHAEMICIREASNILKTWRLSDTTLYVTLEPCAMCAGAILQARIGTLVYGAPNKLLGADGSWIRLFHSSTAGEGGSEVKAEPEGPVHPFHPNMTIRRGILEAECADAMQQFFRLRRKKDKKIEQPDEQRSSRKLVNPSKLLQKMHHIFHFLFCL